MNLFFLRHASAGTRRVNPLLDVRRPLDREGKQHCLQLAHVLSGMKVSFDLVVSSPLKRSVQTAQLVSTEMGYEAQILLSQRRWRQMPPFTIFSVWCSRTATGKICWSSGTVLTCSCFWGPCWCRTTPKCSSRHPADPPAEKARLPGSH